MTEGSRTPSPAHTVPLPWRAALRGFTTQWLLIPQGTGIVAIILHQLDYQFHGLKIISYLFWIATMVLLVVMVLACALRCILFPRHVPSTLRQGDGEMDGLASIPICFTSILQMAAVTLLPGWGPHWSLAVYGLWWANVAMAVFAAMVIPYLFFTLSPPGISKISPVSQLPLIAALTAAAGGGTICQYAQLSSELQVSAVGVSYLLVGLGLPLALTLDTLFLARLAYQSPVPAATWQSMILCGPWGQGSFALQGLGQVVLRGSFSEYASGAFITGQAAGPVAYTSMFLGILAWGLGTFWWAFAVSTILRAQLVNWPPKMATGLVPWSVVFPWVRRALSAFACSRPDSCLSYRVFIRMRLWSWGSCLTQRHFECGPQC